MTKLVDEINDWQQRITEYLVYMSDVITAVKGQVIEHNGTGLGLYISKSIIKVRFNGEVYFETNDKKTTFFVRIPLTEEE